MKMKSIFAWVLALGMLSSCSNDDSDNIPEISDGTVAYVSIAIATEKETRASGEDAGANESALNTLYLMTFDAAGNILGIPDSPDYAIKITGTGVPGDATPDAQKVSANAKNLLVIANPGTKLEAVINSINATTTYATINTAVASVRVNEMADAIKGYTMINSGDETGLSVNQKITNPFIDLTGKIFTAANEGSDAAAKSAAEAARVEVRLERLAAKLELKLAGTITVEPQATGATFTFGNWLLDAVNTTFYPFAEKTILSVTHNSTLGYYVNNFYTKDPNFDDSPLVGVGLEKVTVNTSGDYSPVLPGTDTWLNATDKTYRIENTMAAAEQKYGNATRMVIKGTYYPVSTWTGDWFNFAGVNYETLALLQAAYSTTSTVPGESPLRAAADKMYTKISDYASANSITLTGTDFATLTVADLAQIPNGGEVIKDGKNNIIRWYQGGLNYYYYEIRHDNDATANMAFGKYGIVRNNWYSLTLGSVKGPGTPWYPDIDNPGPGDPEPVDPIDEESGYLGIEVKVAPWILWENTIGI